MASAKASDDDEEQRLENCYKRFSTEEVGTHVVQSGVVPQFVNFLSRFDFPQLQAKAARVLALIAFGPSDYTLVIVESGAVPCVVKLLTSEIEDAAWALGNIASDIPRFRDVVLYNNALAPLMDMLNPHSLRMVTWTLSKLWWGRIKPFFEETNFAEPYRIDFCYLSVLLFHPFSSVSDFSLQNIQTWDCSLQKQRTLIVSHEDEDEDKIMGNIME